MEKEFRMSPALARKLGTEISPGPKPITPSGAIPSKNLPLCFLPHLQHQNTHILKNHKHRILKKVKRSSPYNNSSLDRRRSFGTIRKMQDVLNEQPRAGGVVASVANGIRTLLLRTLTGWSWLTELMAAGEHLAGGWSWGIILVKIFSSLQKNICSEEEEEASANQSTWKNKRTN